MSKKTVRDIDLKGKKVIERCDFNVPLLEDGTIMTFAELARRYGFYNDGVPDSEHAKEVYTKKLTETPEKTPDKIIEELDYEYEDPRIQNGRDM